MGDFFYDYALLGTIVILIGAAALMVAVPQRYPTAHRALAVVASFLVFALSVYVFVAYDYGRGGAQFANGWDWLEEIGVLGANGIRLSLSADGISSPLIMLNGTVIFAGSLVSWKIQQRNKDFFILLFLLAAGVFGVFASDDLFFFFFFYELAVLPMFLLIGVWGSSTDFGTFLRSKEYGAMKLTMYLVAGSVLVWVAIFATFVEAGAGTFDLGVLAQHEYPLTFQRVFFPLYLIGFGVLAGLWPFHTWSPDGHVAAPTAVSMLHAGVLMKLGAFGILRVGMVLFPEGAAFWMPALIVFGTIGAVYGAVSAMGQRDLKYMVGYSSVSHMGYVLIGLASLNEIGVNGAVLQMFSHGMMTALMFTLVGSIYDQSHLRDMAIFGGLARTLPRYTVLWSIAGLTSLGLPGLSGFVAEFHIFVGVFQTYPVFGALAVIAAAITAAYILRMLAMAFFGPFNERWKGLTEMNRFETAGAALLVAFIVWMGVWPDPFVDRISASVLRLPGITS